jgi:preprotein translocase subunit SecD
VAAPAGQLKVSRYLAVLLVVIAILYGLVFLTGTKKAHPKLGMDLAGGTSLTLTAVTPDGKAPSGASLDQARSIIASRVNASGVAEPEVVTEGNNRLVVNVAAGTSPEELKKLVAPARLAFRKVLYPPPGGQPLSDRPVTTGLPPDACGAAVTEANATSSSPSASGSASASASGSAHPSASASASKAASASPTATPTATGTPSASVNPSASAAAALKAKFLADAQTKVGPAAWTAAQNIQDPSQIDPQTLVALAPFAKLNCQEIAALSPEMQLTVPTVTCAALNARDPGSIDDPNVNVAACDQGTNSHNKYYLDKAKVVGTDVASAGANFDPQQGGWYVGLSFTGKGQSKWTALTQEAVNDGSQPNQQTGQPSGQNSAVAIVLDNEVVSAPQIKSVIVGDAIINGGDINEQTSKVLANQLKYGALPLSFKIETIQSVSPTLGLQQMQYGLLAGAIGLVLVIAYCLFYYRGLGLVVISSLAISGLLVFASLVLLGRYIGFTLSLAGIAGFIVAIGITADSFVVFFERLKDEVKDGRTVRSAVPRAWVRARRTILSADAVSFLAAAVLYLLAAGPVKGFAFTLGMSTIIDLLVVFLFTHPLVALLSRSSAFTSPRFSGLGNARSDKAIEAATRPGRFGAVRTKES